MRYIIIIFIFLFFSFNVYAQKIATFKFQLILENLKTYNEFKIQINEFKKKKFIELKKEEEILTIKQNEISDSRILLSESEYLKISSEFNELKIDFENKVNILNNYLKENIELNEKLILNEIIQIVKKIAVENNIDIIFFDEQYFLASDKVDISDIIYNELNNIAIKLQLLEYE